MATISGGQEEKKKTDAPQQQRDISLAEVYQVVRDEFALYFASIDLKRRTCINNTWKRLGLFLFWQAAADHDNDPPTTTTTTTTTTHYEPPCEVHQPTSRHTHTIIFLHGRDSTAEDFAPELLECQDSQNRTLQQALPSLKWVFPTAPLVNSQWFDMHTTEDPHEGEEEQDPTRAIDLIHRILAKEAAILGEGGYQNMILAGISQGAAVGIHALLKQEHQLGGFIGLNTWLPNPDSISLARENWPQAVKTEVMLAHTRDDPVIDVQFGEELRERLKELDMDVEWHDYETKEGKNTHLVNEPDGVGHIVHFIERVTR